MTLCPLTMLLRLYLDRIRVDTTSQQLRTLLKTVVRESQILRSDASMTSLDSLVLSLQDFEDWKACRQLFEFLDNCILRLVRKRVHYYDMLTELIATAELDVNPRDCQVDLLLITIMEQWRFLATSADAPTVANVSKWLVRYINVMDLGNGYVGNLPLRGETTILLSQIRDQLKADVSDTACRTMFERTLEAQPEIRNSKGVVSVNTINEERNMLGPSGSFLRTQPGPSKAYLPPGPPEEHEDHPGLHQWTRHEVRDAINEGHIKRLILCLCSKYVEIRKQALTGVRAFMRKLEVS